MQPRTARRLRSLGILLLALALVGLALVVLRPRPPRPPVRIADRVGLETYLGQITSFGRPPGLSLVVVKDGRVRYSRGFGMADGPRRLAATPDTVYHWWSMTKIATAIAVLQLVEQHRLDLRDDVASRLSCFRVLYPSAPSPQVTVQQLLTHSSGLGDLGFGLLRWVHREGDPPVNQTAFLETVLPKHARLESPPGTRARYSNLGYIVLGALVEQASGTTYEDYVREHLLRPLRMTRTDFVYTEAMGPNEAAGSHPVFDRLTPLLPFLVNHWSAFYRETKDGHIWLNRVYTDYTPSSGLIGPAPDVARLMLAYLNGGELEGRRLLSAQSVFVMSHAETMPIASAAHPGLSQGLGWIVASGDRPYLQHKGGGPGFGTALRLYPEEKLGITVLTNDTTTDLDSILGLAASLDWGVAGRP